MVPALAKVVVQFFNKLIGTNSFLTVFYWLAP